MAVNFSWVLGIGNIPQSSASPPSLQWRGRESTDSLKSAQGKRVRVACGGPGRKIPLLGSQLIGGRQLWEASCKRFLLQENGPLSCQSDG